MWFMLLTFCWSKLSPAGQVIQKQSSCRVDSYQEEKDGASLARVRHLGILASSEKPPISVSHSSSLGFHWLAQLERIYGRVRFVYLTQKPTHQCAKFQVTLPVHEMLQFLME